MVDYYQKVPAEMRETFMSFRQEHPLKTIELEGISWEYMLTGAPSGQPMLLLPGGLSTAESAWRLITHLNHQKYHILCPSYPGQIGTMTGLADGIASILEREGIQQCYVVGQTYGGMLAQVFAHRHAGVITYLVLSDAFPPEPNRTRRVEPILRILRYAPLFMVRNILRNEMTGRLPANPSPELLLIAAQIRETIYTCLDRQAAINIHLRMADFDKQVFTYTDFDAQPVKTLIMLAEDDPTTTQDLRNTLLAFYPGAVLHLLHGSFQSSTLMDPGEYVTVMEDFFAGKLDENLPLEEI